MRCRNCDAELPEDAAFCLKCGARQTGSVRQAGSADQAAGVRFEALDRMIEDYRRRLDEKPDDAFTRFNLALAYRHQGLDDLALAELERLRLQGEQFADLEYELGALYARRGDVGRAREAAERALVAEPEHPGARRLLRRLAEMSEGRGQQ